MSIFIFKVIQRKKNNNKKYSHRNFKINNRHRKTIIYVGFQIIVSVLSNPYHVLS